MQRIVDEAGVSLSPLAGWVLVRLELDRGVAVDAVARADGIDAEAMSAAVSQLATRRLVTMPSNGRPRALASPLRAATCSRESSPSAGLTLEHDAIALHDIERELIPDPRPPAG